MSTTRRARVAAALLACALASAACGSAAQPSAPTGIDGLTIPTPAPAAEDFVTTVDNPLFPLAVGTRWTYVAADADAEQGDVATRSVEVVGTRTLAGISMTEVRHEGVLLVAPGSGASDGRVRDLFAQDTSGNVWWFGRDDVLFAQPGLWMPAEPRRGDGYRVAGEPGSTGAAATLDVRAEVLGRADAVGTPLRTFTDTWAIDLVSASASEPVTEPVTEPASEPATEPVTESVTELVTERYDLVEGVGVIRAGEWLLLDTTSP